jgi:predicted transcriptional regulator
MPKSLSEGGSYTPGMKTAVSIPDDLFRRADDLARREGKSRSQVYREALAEYLLKRDPESITSALDEVVDDVGLRPDPWLDLAARQALARSDW